MFLLSARRVWLLVQRDGGIWSFLTWTKNHLTLHRHTEMSHEVVEVETLLILQENLSDFLLERIFIAGSIGMNVCTGFSWLNKLNPFSSMWSSWSFGRVLPKRSLVDLWASTTHACFDFWTSLDSLSFSSSSAHRAQRLPLEIPTFPRAFKRFLELLFIQI